VNKGPELPPLVAAPGADSMNIIRVLFTKNHGKTETKGVK
jgi:hypothetical protein